MATTPLPYLVAPTYSWDGVDGLWSTFAIEVGTPPQSLRVVPATIGHEIWAPVVEGCEGLTQLANCGNLRGVDGNGSQGYQTNASTSWNAIPGDPYVLSDGQNLFGIFDTGLYAYDTVAIARKGADNGSVLQKQVIAGIATLDFWLGTMGLGPSPSQFSGDSSAQSLMFTLKNQSLIPSLSYGYTAGQHYHNVPGSLVLGGYDQARLSNTPTPLTLPLNSSAGTQNIQLGLQSVTVQGALGGSTQQLLDGAIFANLDSAVSQLWLPEKVCEYFAEAFGLTYSANVNYYFINDTMHKQMLASNPTLTFSIGAVSGSTVNIDLPYKAFDYNLSQPLSASPYLYFPLRQAKNESQYTIGRVFLQEAYIVVNWDNATITIGQAVAQNSTTSVQPIIAPSPNPATNGSASPAPAPPAVQHHGISTGAIAGIVIVIIALIAAAAGFSILRMRRKRRATNDKCDHEPSALEVHNGAAEEYYPPEKVGNEKSAFGSYAQVNEMESHNRPGMHERKTSELDNEHQIHEMEAMLQDRELMSTPVFELEGHAGNELDSRTRPMSEMSSARRSLRSLPTSPIAGRHIDLPLPSPPLPSPPMSSPGSDGGFPSPPLPSPPFSAADTEHPFPSPASEERFVTPLGTPGIEEPENTLDRTVAGSGNANLTVAEHTAFRNSSVSLLDGVENEQENAHYVEDMVKDETVPPHLKEGASPPT
ncbi:hypothetical protein LTR78_003250 [Recurvomyces mirabilis]|uniref:Peptidase A1 domain-containing protein n=1 Tax=Recurvomyces mirabilis TaxID=574656 RepID=A0AAE1C3Q9_9PEZI|nr:hypothetical protein LTR78_003250 [Recurvomyces mirabilis]